MSDEHRISASARRFLEAVDRFKIWGSGIPENERYGEWECDYPDWSEIYTSWKDFLADTPLQRWNQPLMDEALYAIARDNECQVLANEVPRESLRAVAEAACTCSEPDARWQLAVELGGPPGDGEDLLLKLADDENEYVRRRAVQSLARLGSPAAATLAVREWEQADDDFPWPRMNALWVLHRVSDQSLEPYLARAQESPNSLLREYADNIRRGDVEA
jgi:hypothetical protein